MHMHTSVCAYSSALRAHVPQQGRAPLSRAASDSGRCSSRPVSAPRAGGSGGYSAMSSRCGSADAPSSRGGGRSSGGSGGAGMGLVPPSPCYTGEVSSGGGGVFASGGAVYPGSGGGAFAGCAREGAGRDGGIKAGGRALSAGRGRSGSPVRGGGGSGGGGGLVHRRGADSRRAAQEPQVSVCVFMLGRMQVSVCARVCTCKRTRSCRGVQSRISHARCSQACQDFGPHKLYSAPAFSPHTLPCACSTRTDMDAAPMHMPTHAHLTRCAHALHPSTVLFKHGLQLKHSHRGRVPCACCSEAQMPCAHPQPTYTPTLAHPSLQ